MIDRLNTALEGRYRIERELGAGGMATVFLAEDLRHDRQVALKVLKPELAAVVGAERFLEGANEPLWSRDGGEIFYRRADGQLVATEVRTEPTVVVGRRHALFPTYSIDYNHRGYDVLPGDSVFIMLPVATGGGGHLVVVDNVFTEFWEKVGR